MAHRVCHCGFVRKDNHSRTMYWNKANNVSICVFMQSECERVSYVHNNWELTLNPWYNIAINVLQKHSMAITKTPFACIVQSSANELQRPNNDQFTYHLSAYFMHKQTTMHTSNVVHTFTPTYLPSMPWIAIAIILVWTWMWTDDTMHSCGISFDEQKKIRWNFLETFQRFRFILDLNSFLW